MNFGLFVPRMDQRALFVGKTGCGKSWAARRILQWQRHDDDCIDRCFDHPSIAKGTIALLPRRYVIAYDAKGLMQWPGYHRVTSFESLNRAANNPKKFPKIIYAPNAKELRDENFHEKFFLLCYERGKTTAYVDEWYAVARGLTYPPSAHAILTRGREMGVSIVGSTQRPSGIPQAIMSEADLFFAFHLKMPQDRKKIAEMIPVDGDDARNGDLLRPTTLKKTKFFFYLDGDDLVSGPHKLQG